MKNYFDNEQHVSGYAFAKFMVAFFGVLLALLLNVS